MGKDPTLKDYFKKEVLLRLWDYLSEIVDKTSSKPQYCRLMANIQSAKKRARQTIKKNELKSSQRASVRTAIKSVEQAIEAKDKGKATSLFIKTQKLIDKMTNKKVITKNSASRQKSRLNKNIKLLG